MVTHIFPLISTMSVFDFDSDYVFKLHLPKPLSELIDDNLLPMKDPELLELVNTSVPIAGTAKPGYSEIYRNGAFPSGVKRGLTPDLNTYGKFFHNNVVRKPNEPCFAYREYDYDHKTSADTFTTLTYLEVDARKKRFGSGLLYLLQNSGLKNPLLELHRKIDLHISNCGDYDKDNLSFVLTIFAPNRYEWILTDLMCCDFSITNSSLYDTLGPDVSRYILQMTESPVLVLDRHNIKTILDLKRQFPEDLANLFMLVLMDPLDLDDTETLLLSKSFEDKSFVSQARGLGMTLIDLARVEKIGEIFPHKEVPATLKSTYTISFTLGTTGLRPKGVVLLHQAAGAGITFLFPIMSPPNPGRAFAFLPFAHIYERQNTAFVLSYGGLVGFPQLGGSPATLVDDLKLFKPNHMSNVPRVLTKFEAMIKGATVEHPTSQFTRSLFEKVFKAKQELQLIVEGADGSHFIYDKLFVSKIRAKFGFDNMTHTVSGSAPISPLTVKFLKAALNVGLLQGYGLTECFAGMAVSVPFDINPGNCGATGISTEVRIRELPQMGYHLNDAGGPRGELLMRGSQMFSHYYKNEEETAKAIDEDGWFMTGDVARIDENGRIHIIDRVKNFFKLAQGEYVTPEKVENLYLSANPGLTQLFCHGDSLKHFLVGIAGIDVNLTRNFLIDKCGVPASELTTDSSVAAKANERTNKVKILNYITANTVKETKLQGFEKFHNIFFDIEPLRLDRDVVTPTMKLKRPVAAKYFAKQIDAMYEEGSLICNGSSKL